MIRKLVIIFTVFFASITPLLAQDFEYISSALYSGPISANAIVGNYAYCDIGGYLNVLSIIDPSNPQLIATFPETYCREGFVQGNYLYLTTGFPGFAILDISVPANPVLLSRLSFDGHIDGIWTEGNYAYVALSFQGLLIANVSDPVAPYVVSELDVEDGCNSLFKSGNYIYATAYDSGLVVINIADPIHPFLAGRNNDNVLGDHGLCTVAVNGNYAYVGDIEGAVRIFDISNPTSPIYVSCLDSTDRGGQKIIVDGGYAYLACYWHKDHVIDIRNPLNPSVKYTYDGANGSNSIIKSGSNLFIGGLDSVGWSMGGRGMLHILDVTDPISPTLIGGFYDYPTETNTVCVQGNYAYAGSNGLFIVNISNSVTPVVMSFTDSIYLSDDVVKSGDYLYCQWSAGGLQIVDVSNPSNPILTSQLSVGYYCAGMDVQGTYAYLACGSRGLYIVDISEPDNPVIVSNYQSYPNLVMDVDVSGNLAYFSYEDHLYIADIINPQEPVLVGWYEFTDNPNDIHVLGDYVYLIHRARLTILDVSNPSNPTLAGVLNSPSQLSRLAIQGQYVYANSPEFGICLINVSNPHDPTFMTSYDVIRANDITCDDDIVYVATGRSLTLLNTSVSATDESQNDFPVDLKIISSYPNPFNSSTTIRTNINTPISIYNIEGKLVATLLSDKQGKAVWDASGYSSGVYFARAQAGNSTKSIKLILMK